ncbi:MAG: hypothetical protein COY80_02605 [Candidatus Pacebacteria bacterium CG_4_10_14_0_8_um_filter_42_14]|nr:MAG: hypothetical protein COY80_02605 [Candidatus Pacebacteria bacterium CG_4_10_14_0_8_um_filter_42_14]
MAARKVEKLEGASKYYVGPGNTVLGFDNKGVLLGIKNPFEPDWIARTSTNKDVAVLSSEGLWTWNGEGAGSVNERLTVDFVQSVIDKYPIQDKEKETQIKEEIARLLSLSPAQTLIGISSLIISDGNVALAQESSAKYHVSELEFAVGWRPDAQYANFHNDGQVGTRGSAFVVSDTLYMLTDFYAPSDIGADGASFWRIVIKSMMEMMDKSTTINIDYDPIYQRFRTDISYDPIRHIIIDPLVKGK